MHRTWSKRGFVACALVLIRLPVPNQTDEWTITPPGP
jgi:hypothetical protein